MMLKANSRLRAVGIDPCVDHDGDDNGFRRVNLNLRLSGLDGKLIHLRAKSVDVGPMWSTPIDVLLIDGDHNAPTPENDLCAFAPWVKPGGWLLLDDMHGADVRDAWERVAPMIWGGQSAQVMLPLPGCPSYKLQRVRRLA